MKKQYAFNIQVKATFNQDIYLEVDETKVSVEEAERIFDRCIRGLDDVEELVYRAKRELPEGVTVTGFDKWHEVSDSADHWEIEFDDIREIKDDQ